MVTGTDDGGKQLVGGGPKKILYALNTLRKIGVTRSTKALRSKNTCKACGLGMGGQSGGMVNEAGEFPSVCNKSIQAQSTDIQPPIPQPIFRCKLSEFRKLSGYELEHLGRLDVPLYKAKGTETFKPVSWERAFERIVDHMRNTSPKESFFYSSGRSSNEAGFLLQLLARVYGTNNVNNCSFYCHEASGRGLTNTIGTGTATVELADLEQCDCIFVIGANPASNHPRFIHKLQACRARGGQVVVINPAREPGLVRFSLPKSARSLLKGGDEIASHYVQPRVGGDLAFLKGLAKYLVEQGLTDDDYIDSFTEGYAEFAADLGRTSWSLIESESGIQRSEIEAIGRLYAAARRAVFSWGMGITHHLHGVSNVEHIANLALLRGMVGKPFAGLLPLRGHSNVQGIGSIGLKPVLAEDVFRRMRETLGLVLPDNQESPGLDTLACLEAAHAGKMRFACLVGGNLFQASPDTDWVTQAMDRIDLKVFLTTTLNKGHVFGNDSSESLILPVRARDEESQPTTQESMFNYVRMSDGGICRLQGIRSEVDVIASLGERLSPHLSYHDPVVLQEKFLAFKSHRSIRQAIANIVPGMEQLADIDEARKEFHIKNRILHKPVFKRPGGKARFCANKLTRFNSDSSFPLRLMSVRSEGQFNSIIYEERDSYRKVDNRNVVFMSKSDMQALCIEQGSRVDVLSRYGRMRGLAVKAFPLSEGSIMTYYPEANVLIGRERDPRSKTPAFKSVNVRIQPSIPN